MKRRTREGKDRECWWIDFWMCCLCKQIWAWRSGASDHDSAPSPACRIWSPVGRSDPSEQVQIGKKVAMIQVVQTWVPLKMPEHRTLTPESCSRTVGRRSHEEGSLAQEAPKGWLCEGCNLALGEEPGPWWLGFTHGTAHYLAFSWQI